MFKKRERRKAAQPTARVINTVEDVISCPIPVVSLTVMMFSAVISIRTITVKLSREI